MNLSNNSQWFSIPLKFLFADQKIGAWGEDPDSDEGIICIRAADFITDEVRHSSKNLTRRKYEFEEVKVRQLKAGDLILEKSGGGENQPVGRVVSFELDEIALCSNFLERLRPHHSILSSRFGAYLLYCLWSNRVVVKFIKQTTGIQNLDSKDYFAQVVHIPSLSEQKAIAHYLDKETAKIDELIQAKKQLLELLDEKRRALITHAVTRGLNPDVPMRDSGVEWIGEIPEHWSIQRLKTVSRSLQIGPFGSQLHAEDYVDDGIPVINPVHLVNGKIVPDYQVTVDQETAKRLSIYQLESGDVVFARRGEIGRCGLATQQEVGWLCGSGSLRVRPHLESLNPEYLVLLVSNTFVGKSLSMMSVGTTMENLNTEIVSGLIIPLPPLNEQYSIVSKIKDKICQLDSLKITTENTIQLLKERRTSLITAAVTGQLKIKE